MTVSEVQILCLRRGIPFFSYRLPGEKSVCAGIQLEGSVARFEGMNEALTGFVAVPFEESEDVPGLQIRPDIVFRDQLTDPVMLRLLLDAKGGDSGNSMKPAREGKESYDAQVKAMIEAFRIEKARKLVLARSLTLDCQAYREAPVWFRELTQRYRDAFVFMVSVPGNMVWMGATPEIFMKQDDCCFRTMALAGTQPLKQPADEMVWGDKEREEQGIVSEYIQDVLEQATGAGKFYTEGPFSRPAGNVAHLCTVFRSKEVLPSGMIEQLRIALHPTPAVGGFPKEKALKLLKEIEICDRRYYAGYVGPVYGNGKFDWFVNLRSMELFPDAVRLYIGGGITALSDPEAEWNETELKSRTLLDVMNVAGKRE